MCSDLRGHLRGMRRWLFLLLNNNLLMIFYVKKLAQYPKDDYLCIVKLNKL